MPTWRSWLGLAAGVVLAVGLGTGGVAWLASGRLAVLARLAAGDHQNCAIKFRLDDHPVTLAEGAARFDPAFGRLETTAAPAALSAGAVQVLERHACVYDGQPFAHLVLRYKDTSVSVLVADQAGSGTAWWHGAASTVAASGGFNLSSFQSEGHRVFFVSSLPSADVAEVAQAMRASIAQSLAGL